MKLELSREEVAEVFINHISNVFRIDPAKYDVDVEPAERYSSNAGGLIINLTKKVSDEH